MKVHVNTIFRNNITQQIHLKFMESKFLQFGIKTNFLEFFQHKMYMVFMVCNIFWKNEDVNNVIDHKIIHDMPPNSSRDPKVGPIAK